MIEESKLSNGIRTIIETVPNVRSVALGIYVEVGSAYETEQNNGISHMIEHMLFKGTEKRSAREIAIETARLGDDLNAYTAKEVTCFYARVLDEQLPSIVEILGDMLCHSVFREDDLEKEKGIILDEIDMYEDSPEDMVQEQFQKLAWKGSPLGYIISGKEENVRRITRDELVRFWKESYVAERVLISVAGNVNVQKVRELLESSFSEIPHGKGIRKSDAPTYYPIRQVFQKETEQMHLCMGFPGISHTDCRSYILSMANSILGGSSCSRLFQQIREEQGHCYSIYSYGSSYRNAGTIQIYAGMNPEHAGDVGEGILDVIRKLQKTGPTEEEIRRTLSQIRSELYLSMENTHNRMNHNARSFLYYDRFISPEEMLSELEQIKREDLIRFMQEFLNHERLGITLMGDIQAHPEIKNIIYGI